jgi:hypothetical protein
MPTKTLAATYHDARRAAEVVHDLHSAGIARDDIGWLARTATDELLGFSGTVLSDAGRVLAAGPVVAALIGTRRSVREALDHLGVNDVDADEASLARGGAIVTVTIDDEDDERMARAILHGERLRRSRRPTLSRPSYA